MVDHGQDSSSPPATTWTEQQVRELVERQTRPYYQRIELPYGQATRGDDRSATSDAIFSADMTGRSVLDVGCQIGHFCFDALRRGADRAVGLDINPHALDEARPIADCLGLPAEFAQHDIEQQNIDGRFDDVLCLNVMHHFKNPITALERLVRATRRRLILELPTFARRDRRKFGLSPLIAAVLERLPVMYAGPTGANSKHYSPKFAITPAAVRNMLLFHRNTFAHIEAAPSAFKDRQIVIAHKRCFDRMIVLAGPPSIGKSTLMRNVPADLADRLEMGPVEQWELIDAARMRKVERAHFEKVLFHYNFLSSPMRRTRTYDRDERLDPVTLADRVDFLTLWVEPDEYARRFAQVKMDPYMRDDKYEGPKRFLEMKELVETSGSLVSIYRRWFEYVRRFSGEPLIVHATDQPRIISIDEWESLV